MSVCIPKHSVIKPAGVGILVDPEHGSEVHTDFLQCVHCQGVWPVRPGSGKVRGFCLKCNGPICGPQCHDCIGPWEKRLEMFEAGKLRSL